MYNRVIFYLRDLVFLKLASSKILQEKKLQSVNFQGVKEREWTLESPVRYIKIVGGPANKEGLLLGLKNGQVSKIFLDNPFPVELLKISVPIRCLDLSTSRQKVAIVDDNNTCSVYQLSNGELVSQVNLSTFLFLF